MKKYLLLIILFTFVSLVGNTAILPTTTTTETTSYNTPSINKEKEKEKEKKINKHSPKPFKIQLQQKKGKEGLLVMGISAITLVLGGLLYALIITVPSIGYSLLLLAILLLVIGSILLIIGFILFLIGLFKKENIKKIPKKEGIQISTQVIFAIFIFFGLLAAIMPLFFSYSALAFIVLLLLLISTIFLILGLIFLFIDLKNNNKNTQNSTIQKDTKINKSNF